MAKKHYETPRLFEYGTMEELTQAILPSGDVHGVLLRQLSQITGSDRNLKDHFTPVDTQTILARVSQLPITIWNYKTDGTNVRHIGPMAQDFKAMFGVGQDDKKINLVDANGITLAAIQGLYEMLREKDAQIAELRAELNALKNERKQ